MEFKRSMFVKGNKSIYLLILFAVLSHTGCNDENNADLIPFTFVSEDIYLKDLQYQAIWQQGGYIYMDQVGFRGVILYNEGTGSYRAFERACTHDPRSECEPVKVDDSTLFMVHPCCSSVFDFNGTPTSGPARRSLREYSTYIEGDYLLIRNE